MTCVLCGHLMAWHQPALGRPTGYACRAWRCRCSAPVLDPPEAE